MTKRKLPPKKILFAAVLAEQHENIRLLSFGARKSMARLVREAMTEYLEKNKELIERTKETLKSSKPVPTQ